MHLGFLPHGRETIIILMMGLLLNCTSDNILIYYDESGLNKNILLKCVFLYIFSYICPIHVLVSVLKGFFVLQLPCFYKSLKIFNQSSEKISIHSCL